MTDRDTRTIHERMVAIVGEMPAIGKDQTNQQQNFKFRGIDDVIAELSVLLFKHGVYYTPRVLARETAERTTSKGNSLYVCCLHVEFTFHGLTGDEVVASAWGEGSDSGDKATSKAHTMAQKTALVECFNVRTRDSADPDAETPEESTSKAAAPDPFREVWALAVAKFGRDDAQETLAALCRSRFGKESPRELTPNELDQVRHDLQPAGATA